MPAFLLLMFFVFAPQSHAQEAQTLQLPEQGDVRIIVDISGSMKENDPRNLRQPAVRLLARMIPAGAEAGVWTFGQWVNMLVPHGTVDEAWRQNALALSEKINSVALRTNLGEALEKASDDWIGGADLSNTDFILLTDGRVDISGDPEVNAKERERILGPLLDRLTARGATLHTVALSEEADLKMLEALATESGGHFSLASSAEGLNQAFLKSLNAAVPQDQIPLTDEGFTVDQGVEEFTALIFWGENETSATRALTLTNPGGERFTQGAAPGNMRWAAETGYDLITVTDPQAGQWQIDGELGEGSRVTVVSDLRMVVSPIPPTFNPDEPIALKIAFFEEDSRIQDPDFLKVIDVIVRLTSTDGRSGSKILSDDQPPADGIYQDQIDSLPAAGDYNIEVIADGTTFSRRFSGITRFIAPESASPTDEKAEPQESAPALESPIDISNLEEPPADPVPVIQPEPAPEPAPETSAVPIWVWGMAGGTALVLIAGGVWFWLRRKKTGTEEAEAGSGEEELPELEEDIPELEPEVEPEPETEPEPQPEPEPEKTPEEDEDEFGLEDFDLSEFDDLPESDEPGSDDDDYLPEEDPKKGE
ncbi:vWA domain-containing protein [Marinobacter halotolerans]|uniref:vWA domain-containing protein n=1 Tax=Marinobacter halotolerans TaxID=1569211 RepID=UPI0012481888|nr:vWA domain-containing protein [Marinobacter halotolerans]